jgi:hypothetical protein
MTGSVQADGYGGQFEDESGRFRISRCEHCQFPTIWLSRLMVFPQSTTVERPSTDLPTDSSPRGAAALLRLAIQKLCKHLGGSGKDINADIKALVAAGLPNKVQEALDSVRVIGNEAVHPGSLDLRDDRDTASKLFKLVNFVAQKMITEPKEIADIYNSLPAEKLQGIQDRDNRKP